MEFVIGFFVMGMMYEPAGRPVITIQKWRRLDSVVFSVKYILKCVVFESATYNQRTVCFSPEMNNSLDQQFNVSFMYKPLQ